MTTIRLDYKPRPGQAIIHADPEKFRIVVAHRRFGKTIAMLTDMTVEGLKSIQAGQTNVTLLYCAPTYRQAEMIAWEELKKLTENFPEGNGIIKDYNNSKLRFKFGTAHNHFSIHLKGTENADSLRGIGAKFVVLDEYGDMSEDVWNKVIYPMTLDYPDSRVVFIGTPKGKNSFYRLYQDAADKENWSRHFFDVHNSGVFSEEQIEDIKKDVDPDSFAQEFELSWSPITRGSIYRDQMTSLKNSGRFGHFPPDNRVAVSTAWDLGVADSTCIIFFQQVANEVRIVGSYTNTGKGLDHYVHVLNQYRDSYGINYGYHIAPHDMAVREFSSGQTRVETARDMGYVFRVLKVDSSRRRY